MGKKNHSNNRLTPEQLEELRIQREKKKAEKAEAQRVAAEAAAKKKRKKIITASAIALAVVCAIVLAIVAAIALAPPDTYYAKMTVKDHGVIILKLDAKTAPITVKNFVKLVEDDFYDGLTFHRIVDNFMIQGGDPKADGTGNAGSTIKGEFSANGHENNISHKRGVISMARGGHSMDSASCQFFICNADASESLDGSYAAFGHVISGMDVVDSITAYGIQHTIDEVITDKSLQPIITSVEIISEEEALGYTKQ